MVTHQLWFDSQGTDEDHVGFISKNGPNIADCLQHSDGNPPSFLAFGLAAMRDAYCVAHGMLSYNKNVGENFTKREADQVKVWYISSVVKVLPIKRATAAAASTATKVLVVAPSSRSLHSSSISLVVAVVFGVFLLRAGRPVVSDVRFSGIIVDGPLCWTVCSRFLRQ
jgi:hypothetical protein